jgi:hypothetical protein
MILTVEVLGRSGNLEETISEVAICCDREGLDFIIKKLELLRAKPDHVHFMTPSWAGNELGEEKQGGDDYTLVNHLRIVRKA